jgi:hypothetical protein
MGKTAAALAAMKTVFNKYRREVPDFREFGRLPVVYVEVPAGSTPKSMMAQFAKFLGLPVETRATLDSLQRTVVCVLQEVGTKLIVVDELHHLSDTNRSNIESSDLLKSLSNQVSATFVYAGINLHGGRVLAGERGQQIAGRFTMQSLHRYTTANADEWRLWNGIVRAFEEEFCLLNHKPGDLADHSAYLYDRTQGAIGSLVHLLTLAAQLLVLEDFGPEDERITLDLLDTIDVDIAAQQTSEAILTAAPKAKPALTKPKERAKDAA